MKTFLLFLGILLINSTTLFAAQFDESYQSSYRDRGPGYSRPGPIRPIRPTPVPMPVYPGYPGHPHHPVNPVPVYPGPVYPIPGYPVPIEPPHYPNPSVQKTIYVNRYMQFESINLTLVMGLNYNYQGYRVRHVYVDVSQANGARIDLLINGRVVDSKSTYGGDVYLYPDYNVDFYYANSDLRVGVTGGMYVNRITVELERY